LNARIMELERSAKGNEERFEKLEQKQCNTVDRLENGDNSSEDDSNSLYNVKTVTLETNPKNSTE
ncbi:36122_t:CDS:2, partial [Racocetra persica]